MWEESPQRLTKLLQDFVARPGLGSHVHVSRQVFIPLLEHHKVQTLHPRQDIPLPYTFSKQGLSKGGKATGAP